jgi:hypothetical protein
LALHSGKNNDKVQLYAFDILALDGHDLRPHGNERSLLAAAGHSWLRVVLATGGAV